MEKTKTLCLSIMDYSIGCILFEVALSGDDPSFRHLVNYFIIGIIAAVAASRRSTQ